MCNVKITHHCKINTLLVLEGVQQTNKPFAFSTSQNISFSKNMSDLVKLEKKLLGHDLQGTNFSSVLLRGEEDLSITTLSNLCENLEISLAKTNTPLSKIRTLSSHILLPNRIIRLFRSFWRIRKFGLEVGKAILSRTNVT